MHWQGCNDSVPLLNEATSQIFQPTDNSENLPVFRLTACLPRAVRHGCARRRAPRK